MFQDILHAGDVKFKFVDEDVCLVSGNKSVRWVLWVGCIEVVGPSHNGCWELSDSCMYCTAIFGIPDHESVVLAYSSQEPIIRTERKFFDANLHSLENSDWLLSLEVPQDDRSIWSSLEYGTLLTSCNNIS